MTGTQLLALGYPDGPLVGHALQLYRLAEKRLGDEAARELLARVREQPDETHYTTDTAVNDGARRLAKAWRQHAYAERFQPRDAPLPYRSWGDALIDATSRQQMENALRLPVSVGGALMPDAHVGYGLPIGGVLATENAIIPYAVGVDIACRVMMTLYSVDDPDRYIARHAQPIESALRRETAFGQGAGGLKRSHPVLDDERFGAIPILKRNHHKAAHQLGSSGSGNHFVDVGVVDVFEDAGLEGVNGPLAPGRYLGIMSHSGSRALGKAVCDEYSRRAMDRLKALPSELKHLAWLDMDTEDGQEYFEAMNLCGDYASANHHLIHKHLAKNLGLKPVLEVENHHNFGWVEEHQGRKVYVHRKGATPAAQGELGVIPGSMADASYLVRGKGGEGSFASASHGAGRRMGRRDATRRLSKSDWDAALQAKGVRLLGGAIDESPMAYKPIDEVMAEQADLVEPIARFAPRIVLMAGEKGDD